MGKRKYVVCKKMKIFSSVFFLMWLVNINYSIIATVSESNHSEGFTEFFPRNFLCTIPSLLLVCQFALP